MTEKIILKEEPSGYWVFSVRVGTTKLKMTTTQMKHRLAIQIGKIAGVSCVEVEEDFSKDPLKSLFPKEKHQ